MKERWRRVNGLTVGKPMELKGNEVERRDRLLRLPGTNIENERQVKHQVRDGPRSDNFGDLGVRDTYVVNRMEEEDEQVEQVAVGGDRRKLCKEGATGTL
jgi:hypothetical protein